MPFDVGSTVAGYRIQGTLGRGGMGTVYEARQLSLDRVVAVKVLSPELSLDETFRERFRREGLIQARIDHAHIVPVYEAGEHDGDLFLSMRLVRGPTLKDLITGRELEAARTLRILGPVADALDVAHQAGLIHRDIKPQNILVGTRDHAYLADFGLTKGPTEQRSLTRTGQFVGTLDYISPEQIRGETATSASDVYSLGAVLYECLTGVVPYPKPSDAAVLFAHMAEVPPLVTAQRPDLPKTLDAVLVRAMAKDPAERHRTALELMSDAERAFGRRIRAAITPPLPPDVPEESGIRRREDRVSTLETRVRNADDLLGEPSASASAPVTPTAPAPPAEPGVPASTERPGSVVEHGSVRAAAPVAPDTDSPTVSGSVPVPAAVPAPSAAERSGSRPIPVAAAAATGVEEAAITAPVAPARPRRAPAPPSTAGRRRAGFAAVGIVLALAALAVGFLTGRSGGGGDPVAAAPSGSASNGDLELRFAAPWRSTGTPPRIPGLGFTRDLNLRLGTVGTGLSAGEIAGSGPSLLPPAFLRRLPGEPARTDRVRIGTMAAYRYRGLRPEGFDRPLTLYVLPTTVGVTGVACYGARARSRVPAACEQVADSLRLVRGRALPLGPDRAYARRVDGVVRRLNARRVAGRRDLRAARTRRGQARAAARLAAAYRVARRDVVRTDVGPAARPTNRRLQRSLSDGEAAHERLASAARRGQRARYRDARREAGAADRAIAAALTDLRHLGYTVR